MDKDFHLQSIKNGDDTAFDSLCEEFEPLLKAVSAKSVYSGIEWDDLLQMARYALHKAAISYKEGEVGFPHWAKKVVTNQMIDICRREGVQKRREQKMQTVRVGEQREKKNKKILQSYSIETILPLLSDFEQKVLLSRIAGLSYTAIAEKLNCSVKSVDNAMTRIRAKYKTYQCQS